jgi:hypothetical protein
MAADRDMGSGFIVSKSESFSQRKRGLLVLRVV